MVPFDAEICAMKLVLAVIKPFKLEEVREALAAIGVAGLTASEAKGFGRQKGQTEIYRGAEYAVNMLPKVRIEIATSDELAPRVVETIRTVANTGTIGDGKIFVLELGDAVRIRTGETGELAL
jgi:nitrogen regulatory protein PII